MTGPSRCGYVRAVSNIRCTLAHADTVTTTLRRTFLAWRGENDCCAFARASDTRPAAQGRIPGMGMDSARADLYFFTMPKRRQPEAEAAPNPRVLVPAFFLYGEPLRPPDERLVHIETIAARSRLHDWTINAHRHRDLHQVLLIQHGRLQARLDGRAAGLRAPAAVIVPPGTIHAFQFQPDTAGVVISFAAAAPQGLQERSTKLPEFLERPAALALPRAAMAQTDLLRLSEMLLREFGRLAPGRRLALAGLLGALLANLQRLLPDPGLNSNSVWAPERDLIARFRAQVEQHFRSHMGIGEYAARLQASEARLLRACLAVTGESPLELVHRRVLIEAERQLRYTSMSVTQVAYHLGFEDPAYFSRFFTRRMGLSPRAFRHRDALSMRDAAGPSSPPPEPNRSER